MGIVRFTSVILKAIIPVEEKPGLDGDGAVSPVVIVFGNAGVIRAARVVNPARQSSAADQCAQHAVIGERAARLGPVSSHRDGAAVLLAPFPADVVENVDVIS